MTFADTPYAALRRTARSESEEAAIDLLEDCSPWLRRPEVAQHITLTVPSDHDWDDPDSGAAVVDWDGVAVTLDEMYENQQGSRDDIYTGILAIACSLANGHKIDLRRVVNALRPEYHAAAVALAILRAARHREHVVRWPKKPDRPSNVRIVDVHGNVVQEAGTSSGEEWHEFDHCWPLPLADNK